MSVAAFDTHRTVKSLVDAGADEPLAEAIVDAVGGSRERLATRTDIDLLKGDIESLEHRMEAGLYRVAWIQAVGIVAAVAALKLVP